MTGRQIGRGVRCHALVSVALLGLLAFAPPGTANHQAGVLPQQYVLTPRVLDLSNPTPTQFHVTTTGNPGRVELALFNGGVVALKRVSDNEWETELTPAQILNSYEEGQFHQLLGRVRVYAGGAAAPAFDGFVVTLVKPAAPNSPIVRLGDKAQAAPHVLNLRHDTPLLGRAPPSDLVKRIYDELGDDYEFLAVVDAVDSHHNRFYMGVRNHIKGIGLPDFDRGVDYGSPNRLEGIIPFPIASYFDPAEHAMNHEIGHRWSVFVKFPTAQPSAPGSHWPFSDLAYGVMGFSLPDGAGGTFSYRLSALPTGDFQLVPAPPARAYNDVELYLMGLAPPAEVKSHVVMHIQDWTIQNEFMTRGFLKGPAYSATADSLIASHGPRDPPFGQAPNEFRLAVVVLSAGRLLTPGELTFFDLVAARAEATTELPYRAGTWSGMTLPFYLATGGRARLSTTLVGLPIPSAEPSTSPSADPSTSPTASTAATTSSGAPSTTAAPGGTTPTAAASPSGDGATPGTLARPAEAPDAAESSFPDVSILLLVLGSVLAVARRTPRAKG